MHHDEALNRVGRSALGAFQSQSEWIHRRVEALTFPSRNDPIVRRRISIDFTIPHGLRPTDDDADADADADGIDADALFYVPVSVLRKWPPVLQLDLRNEQGEAIPLLTREQNGVADAALLVALAEQAAGPERLLSASIQDHLQTIAQRPGDEARAALIAIVPPDASHDDDVRSLLRNDAQFLDLAGGLVDNTLLWLRVSGKIGDRRVLKFAYDVARELDVSLKDAAAFGMAPLKVKVDTPHIGSSGSYHLAVISPAPLDIVDAEITLRRRATPLHNLEEGEAIARCTAKSSRNLEGPLEPPGDPVDLRLYADALGRQARFYIAGRREGCFGQLEVSISVQKEGFLRGAAIASTLIAALLLAYAAAFAMINKHPERLIPVLLLVPALLVYLLVRPDDHSLAREFLAGSRLLLLLSGLLPIVCAGSLATAGSGTWVHVVAWGACGVAVVAAAVLWLGVILPFGAHRMPLSSDT